MSFSSAAVRRFARRVLPTGAILLSLLARFWAAESSTGRRIGVSLDAARPLAIGAIEPGYPAARDGLMVGDEIVAIGGVEVDSRLDYDVAIARLPARSVAELTVMRDGRRAQIAVRLGIPIDWVSELLDAALLLALLGLAWAARRQAVGDLRTTLLEGLALAVAFEFALPSDLVGHPWVDTVVSGLSPLLNGVQFGLELHLAALIPTRPRWLMKRRWVIPLVYALGLLVGGSAAVSAVAENFLEGRYPGLLPAFDFVFRRLFFPAWALALGAVLSVKARRSPEPRGRHQAGLVLLGSLPWIASVLVGAGQDLLALEHFAWQASYSLLLLPFPVAVFIAIYRYRLFDIELVVRRGLIYTALTTTLLIIFYLALGAGGLLFSRLVASSRGAIWVVSGATLLLGLLFAPLRHACQRLIDRQFFPERRELRRQLVALAAELPAYGALPAMGDRLVRRVAEIFHVPAASLLLAAAPGEQIELLASTGRHPSRHAAWAFPLPGDDPGVTLLRSAERPLWARQLVEHASALAPVLSNLEAELVVPVLSQERLVGLLVLGRRLDGEPYSAEESELLALLGHHVASIFENARLFASATYESLTGLLRREPVLDLLERECARAERYGRPLAVALIDLDHFKAVNDRFGHLGGDRVLAQVAQVFRHGLRAADGIGRFGGEEFLAVLPETDLAAAQLVAEKLRRAVAELQVPLEEGQVAEVTVSIGLAATPPRGSAPATPARELIAAADRALYEAKAAGRNRVSSA